MDQELPLNWYGCYPNHIKFLYGDKVLKTHKVTVYTAKMAVSCIVDLRQTSCSGVFTKNNFIRERIW